MTDQIGYSLRLRQLGSYVSRAGKKYLGFNKTIYVQDRVDQYRSYWQKACDHLSLELVEITNELWEIRSQERHFRVANYKIPINDPVAFHVCADKSLCYKFAKEQNIPVPKYAVFRLGELEGAKEFIAAHHGAFVVKPAHDTGSGRGVTTQVRTPRQLTRAAILASTYCREYLVEEMIPAESCKLLILGGKLIHASRRRGVRVTGDGEATIDDLVARSRHPKLFDLNSELTLSTQGMTPNTVLDPGREVVARCFPLGENNTLELRTVYTETITTLVSPDLADQCARLVRAVGCELASVDVLTNDPGKSLEESGGVFIEINANPGLHHHYNDEQDHQYGVATDILKYLFQIGDGDGMPGK